MVQPVPDAVITADYCRIRPLYPGLLFTQPHTQRVVGACPWNIAEGHGANHSSLPSNDVNPLALEMDI